MSSCTLLMNTTMLVILVTGLGLNPLIFSYNTNPSSWTRLDKNLSYNLKTVYKCLIFLNLFSVYEDVSYLI